MDQRMRQARRIQAAIESILLSDWDPFRVRGESFARDDEYSSYVGPVYHALAAGASAEEIASLLERIESERIGIGGSAPCIEVARKLRALDVHLD